MIKSQDIKKGTCIRMDGKLYFCIDFLHVKPGKGSYTGLRVGVSTAKGLCFGAALPLLSVDTMDILVAQAHDEGLVPEGCRYIVPMIDARRMEVYSCVYAVFAAVPCRTGGAG